MVQIAGKYKKELTDEAIVSIVALAVGSNFQHLFLINDQILLSG